MTNYKDQQPWVPADPGELIQAGKWNEAQQYARAGIADLEQSTASTVEELRVELRNVDAVRFGGDTPEEWSGTFAPRQHNHEGQSVYRRYFKRFDEISQEAFLQHDLGRYPLVDVYELRPVVGPRPRAAQASQALLSAKLLFYYGHVDADEYDLRLRIGSERRPLGVPFWQALAEAGVEYEDDDTIEDVLNDLWTELARDPGDEIDHATTPWVDQNCGNRRTVRQLKDADQWRDLRLGIRPVRAPMVPVAVTQVDYGILHVSADQAIWRRASEFYLIAKGVRRDPFSQRAEFAAGIAAAGLDPNDPLPGMQVPEVLDLMFLLRI
jgi:hypothetical protein